MINTLTLLLSISLCITCCVIIHKENTRIDILEMDKRLVEKKLEKTQQELNEMKGYNEAFYISYNEIYKLLRYQKKNIKDVYGEKQDITLAIKCNENLTKSLSAYQRDKARGV